MKILFFGLGSNGKRYVKLIREKFDYKLFAYRTKLGQETIGDIKIKEIYDLKKAFEIKPHIAFITNPTFLHVPTALKCVKRNISLFIEKPISHSLDNIQELSNEIKRRKLFTYIAYNMRFHPVITNIKDLLSEREKPIYFRAICSSYLPNWRLQQDYSKSYSAKKKFGGGVTLDLSHEFDYISWLFGKINKIKGYCDRISNLNIDSEDILEAQITCSSNIKGNLHLDFFCINPKRELHIYFNDEYIVGNLLENKIIIIKKNVRKKIMNFTLDNDYTYQKQLIYFFDRYQRGNINIMNNFSEALPLFKKLMDFKKKYCII